MPDNQAHKNPIWITLDQMVKYVRGNLLGEKKQEVEDQIMASPLIADAIEGLKQVDNPEKLQKTVDALNRQIQLKSGASDVVAIPETAGATTSKANNNRIWAIAASAALIACSAVAIWYFIFRLPNAPGQPQGMVIAEKEKVVKTPETEQNTKESSLAFADSAVAENDSSKTTPNELLAMNDALADEKPEAEAAETVQTKDAYKANEAAGKKLNLSGNETRTAEATKKPTVEEAKKGLNNTVENTGIANNSKESNMAMADSVLTESDDELDSYSYRSKAAPSSDAVKYQKAVSYLKNNDLTNAEKTFEELADDKNSSYQDDAIWNLAQIYLKQGNDRDAKKMFRKIKDSAKYGTQAKEALDKL
ncbi:tetratricopeptide repeat protein [bacterium]|nr:tetratricopeptide repeat protein [bacterium]